MKILAIEASGPVAGCALTDGGKLIGEFEINNKKTHSQTLLPMMDDLKNRAGCDLESLDAIAITRGPGSFTGLRIGAATAKGVALALQLPIIPVPTVDALAFNLYGTPALVCPIMDARRQQVYTGIYEEEATPVTLRGQCAIPIADLIADLNERGRAAIFLGDGVPVYRTVLDEELTVPHSYAPSHLSLQRAATVAALAEYLVERDGEKAMVSADDFRPEYLRKSQAERQMEEAARAGEMDALAAGRLVKDRKAKNESLPGDAR